MLRRPLFRLINQSNLLSIPQRSVYRSALDNPEKTAVIDSTGRYSYSHLLSASVQLRDKLLSVSDDKQKSASKRIAFLCNPDASFVVAQWTCWLSRAICIPLCKDHPQALLDYYIDDAKCSHLIVSPEYEKLLRPLADKFKIPLIMITGKDLELGKANAPLKSSAAQQLDIFSKSSDDALILYTSGTTGKPKVDATSSFLSISTVKSVGCRSYDCNSTCADGRDGFGMGLNERRYGLERASAPSRSRNDQLCDVTALRRQHRSDDQQVWPRTGCRKN